MRSSPVLLSLLFTGFGLLTIVAAEDNRSNSIVHRGFAAFKGGTFGDSGANTYVSARGRVQTIHRWDLNRDGEIDLVFTQDHNADYAPDAMIYWGATDGPASLQPELPELRSPYTLLKHAEQALKQVTWLPSLGGGRCRLADLNRDGFPDIISGNMMHNFRQDMPAYIYWGGAQGFKESDRTILPAYIASGIAVGDFNEDGLPDVVLANQGYERGFDARFGPMLNSLESFIYWGHPAGFDISRRSGVPTISAADVAAGDFNGDGHLDLAFVNNLRTEQSVYVYWGDGTGTFSEVSRQILPLTAGEKDSAPGLEINTATVGDVNRDGVTDLVVAGNRRTVVLPGTKGGNLSVATNLPADNCHALKVTDLNADGWPDLVVANAGVEPLQPKSMIYWGGAEGFRTDQVTALATRGAMAVDSADLNRDGWTDLVFGNLNTNHGEPAQIFWGSAQGYSDLRRRDLQAFGTIGVGVADLNRDGNADVVLMNHLSGSGESSLPTSIYWGNSEHVYSANASTHLFPGGYMMYTVADLDDDSWADLVTVTEGHAFVWWGDSAGYAIGRRTALPIAGLPGGDGVLGLNVADLDRDGWLDLVCTGRVPKGAGPQGIVAYGGPGRFQTARTESFPLAGGPATVGASAVAVADLNHDGWLDLILPLQDIAKTEIRWGSSQGYTAGRVTTLESNGASQAAVADLDGDGRLDLVLTSGLMGRRPAGQPVVGGTGVKGTTRNSRAFIYWGNAAWDARERTDVECYNGLDVTVADLNRDGHLDLAFSSYMSDTTRELPAMIYWGDGTRSYSESRRLLLDAASSSGIDALDLNRDGWLDLVVTNHQKNFSHVSGTNIYWGGDQGYSMANRTLIPTIGSHLDAMVDAGNIADRRFEWEYTSAPIEARKEITFDRLRWKADTSLGTGVKFQVRSAVSSSDLNAAAWTGPTGARSFYLATDTKLAGVEPGHHWLQYRAVLTAPDGGNSAQLTEVDIVCSPR